MKCHQAVGYGRPLDQANETIDELEAGRVGGHVLFVGDDAESARMIVL